MALERLIAGGVTLRRYPTEVLRAAQKIALDMDEEEAAKNAAFRKRQASWKKHREDAYARFSVAEQGDENFAYVRGRSAADRAPGPAAPAAPRYSGG